MDSVIFTYLTGEWQSNLEHKLRAWLPKNSNKESGRKKEPPGNTFSVEKAEVSEFINPSRPDLNVEREPPLLALCHPYDYEKKIGL